MTTRLKVFAGAVSLAIAALYLVTQSDTFSMLQTHKEGETPTSELEQHDASTEAQSQEAITSDTVADVLPQHSKANLPPSSADDIDERDIVQSALDASEEQKNQYYEFLEQRFPELQPVIQDYRMQVKSQQAQINAFEEKVRARNLAISSLGTSNQYVDDELLYERNKLLEQAQVLGKQAMELNAAIRLAAESE